MIEKLNIVQRLAEDPILTTVERAFNLVRANSVWYLLMGLASVQSNSCKPGVRGRTLIVSDHFSGQRHDSLT